MTFGSILKELLEEHHISQKEVALALHLASSTVGNYIRNIREPDYETLKKIAEYFHVSTDYLLGLPATPKITHSEEHLLNIYRSLSKEQKELYMQIGQLFLKRN